MKNKNEFGVVILLIGLSVIRTIGVDGVPLPAISIIMALCMIIAFINAKNYKGNKKEHIYLYIMIIITTFLLGTIVVFAEVGNYYPEVVSKFKLLFLSIIIVLFFGLLVVAIANAVYKNNYRLKK